MLNVPCLKQRQDTTVWNTVENSEWFLLAGRYGFNQAVPSNPDGMADLIRLNTWSK